MTLTLVLVLLVAHFVGDFLCQSDWMALNKSKRLDALLQHVCAYTVAVAFVYVFAGICLSWPIPDQRDYWLFLIVNAVAHFVQDAITSRINARLWFVDGAKISDRARSDMADYLAAIGEISTFEAAVAVHERLREPGALEVLYNNNRHWFFVSVGFDQLLHYVTLFVTASWWLQ